MKTQIFNNNYIIYLYKQFDKIIQSYVPCKITSTCKKARLIDIINSSTIYINSMYDIEEGIIIYNGRGYSLINDDTRNYRVKYNDTRNYRIMMKKEEKEIDINGTKTKDIIFFF